MSPDEACKKLVGQWLNKADEDYIVLERLFKDEEPILIPIAFHAQQAVEKYLKAYLTSKHIDFPKTHDIQEIRNLIASVNPGISEELKDCDLLTPYGVEIRYPSDFPDVTFEEAKQAVELVRRTRQAILDALKISQDK